MNIGAFFYIGGENKMAKKQNNRGIINLKDIESKLTMDSVLEWYDIKHSGNRMVCPFPDHDEETGSFFLFTGDDGKEYYKCHGCNRGGSPLKFIMHYENVSFHKAVDVASKIVDIEPIYSKVMSGYVKNTAIEDLLEWLNDNYFCKADNWITTETKSTPFIDYLNKRKIDRDVAFEYRVGFSDGEYEEILIQKAIEFKVIPKAECVEDVRPLINAGLLFNPNGTDDIVASIRNAVVFPIIVEGKIKGFIYRNTDEDKAKYIKTTNYGLFNVDEITEGEPVILVEGTMDALSIISDFNIVALLGVNALTSREKSALLKANRVYILFDDDNSGREGALRVAEELGYKGLICKPLGAKDINNFLTESYKGNLPKREDGFSKDEAEYTKEEKELALNNAKSQLFEKIENISQGLIVKDEDGNVIYDDNEEPVRSGGASGLLELEFEAWKKIPNDFKRIEAFQKLVATAYKMFNGDSGMLELFSKQLKEFNIKGTYFKEVLDKVKKEVVLEKPISSADESNSLAVSNFGQEWVDWEVIDGVLYRNIPEFKEDGSGFVQEVISITAPKIDCTFKNIITKKNEVQISFIDKYGKHTEIITERKNIAQKSKIIDTLTDESFDIVDSTSADIVNYLKWYENNNLTTIKEKYLTNVTGYYDDDTFIGRMGEIIKVGGLVSKDDSKIVYKNINEDATVSEITEINYDKWKVLTKEVFPRLLLMNERKNSIGIIAWFLSSVYKEHIQKKNKKKAFVPLDIFGVQGSGKTSLVSILQKLLGGTDNIKSASTKLYTMVVNMSLSNSYPFLLDEYKLENIGETQNKGILKFVNTAYNSNMEQRGNGNKPMINFKLQTPICVIGEHAFTAESSDSVKDRSAIFEFSRSWLEDNFNNTEKIINEVNSLDLNEFFGGYLVFILNTIKDKRFDLMYEKAEKRALEFAEQNKKLMSRNILAITILAFGIEVLKELYKEVGLECDITDEDIEEVFYHSMEHILSDELSETSLDRAMNYFSTFIFDYLNEDEKALDSDNKMLYIQQSKFYEHLERHRNEGKAPIPNKSGMKTYIKNNMKSKNRYVVEINKAKTINGKTKKCIVFDIEKLDEVAHIEVDEWIGTKEVEQDYYYDGITSTPHRTEEARDRSISSKVKKIVVKKLEGKLKIRLENVNTDSLDREIYKRVKKDNEDGKLIIDNLVSELISDLTKFWENNEDKISVEDSETWEALLENFKAS